MEKVIKSLIVLQDFDLRSYKIRQQKDTVPSRLKTLEKDLEQAEKQMDEDLNNADSIRRERRQLEQNIADLDSRIGKSKIKLANIKSNKEYTAALKEIEDLEREKAHCEDRILEIMETAEAVEIKCKAIQNEKNAFRKKYEHDLEEIKNELESLDLEMRTHEAEIARIREEIDDTILKRYDYIKEHKDGIGLSSVIRGICQTCHLGIPPQKFNELMRGAELMNCPHCMRIIYWGEDERYQ